MRGDPDRFRAACAGRRRWLPAWTCALVLLAGCGSDNGGSPQGDESYLPHSDGFTWTYRIRRDGAEPTDAVATIDGSAAVGSVQAQRLVLTGELGSGEVLGRIDAQQVVVFRGSFFERDVEFQPPLELLSLPFELGDDFSSSARVGFGLLSVQLDVRTRVVGFGPKSAAGQSYEDAFRLESTVTASAANVAFEVRVRTWLAPQRGVVAAEIDIPDNPLLPVSGNLLVELTEASP